MLILGEPFTVWLSPKCRLKDTVHRSTGIEKNPLEVTLKSDPNLSVIATCDLAKS